jgi:hypothetical protein
VLHFALLPWTDPDQEGPLDAAAVGTAGTGLAPMARSSQPLSVHFTEPFRSFSVALREAPDHPVRNLTLDQFRRGELVLRHLGPATVAALGLIFLSEFLFLLI